MYVEITLKGGVRTTVYQCNIIEAKAILKQCVDTANNISGVADEVIEEGNIQVARVEATGDSQVSRVTNEGNIQTSRVTDEGNAQVVHVADEGLNQINRVIAEGDVQTQRASDEADRSSNEADRSRDEADRATDQANEIKTITVATPTINVPNKPNGEAGDAHVSYDPATGQFTFEVGFGAKGDTGDTGAGFTPQGLITVAELNALIADPDIGDAWWMEDGGTITYGSQSTSVATDDIVVWVAEGYFFNAGTLTVSPQWSQITDVQVAGIAPQNGDNLARAVHVHSWSDIASGIPENVSNALSRSGGTVTGQVKGITPVDPEDFTRKDFVETHVTNAVAPKADTTYVDSQNNAQNAIIGEKADMTYVDEQNDAQNIIIAEKADETYVNDQIEANGTFVGMITPYSGLFSAIPSNWQLCDGTNGTPNMADSFIMGTNTEGEVGQTGGSNNAVNISHTHTFTGTPHMHSSAWPGNKANDLNAAGTSHACGSALASHPGHTPTIAEVTAGGTLSTDGVDGAGLNVPQRVKLAYIRRMS